MKNLAPNLDEQNEGLQVNQSARANKQGHSNKYENANVYNTSITVDVSALAKFDQLFFNATEIAKAFGRRPDDFWKQEQNREYLSVLVTLSQGNESDFVRTKRGGKYQGTWFHKDLALAFARWISPMFGVQLDRWVIDRVKQEHDRSFRRMESKTGFRPLTDAVQIAHDPVKPHHFSNECDLINRIVLGMPAKKFRELHGVKSVRGALDPTQLANITYLQAASVGLHEAGMDYAERKKHLIACHERRSMIAMEKAA